MELTRIGHLTVVALVVALVATSPVAAAVSIPGGAATVQTADDRTVSTTAATTSVTAQESDSSFADEIYVRSDGDAVLVYSSSSSDGSLDLDVDPNAGIAYFDAQATPTGSFAETGDFSMTLLPSGLSGDGSFQVPKPAELTSLSFSANGETSESTAFSDVSLDVQVPNDAGAPPATVSSTGDWQVTPDRISLKNTFSVEQSAVPIPEAVSQDQELTISSTGQGYTISGDNTILVSESVGSTYAPMFVNASFAEKNLQALIDNSLAGTGISADLSVSSASATKLSSGQYEISALYSLDVTGTSSLTTQQLVAQLSTTPAFDLSSSEASRIVSDFRTADLDALSVSYDYNGGSPTASTEVTVSNYETAVNAWFDLAESAQVSSEFEETYTQSLQQARTTFDAQQASGLENTFTYSLTTQTTTSSVQFDGEAHYDTTNWASYVDELEQRGIPIPLSQFQASVNTQNDQVVGSTSFQFNGTNVADGSFWPKRYTPSEPTIFDALNQTEFEKAKMDVSVDSNQVAVQAGFAANDVGALVDYVSENVTGNADATITGVTANETGSGDVEVYVYVENMFDSGVTESQVRSSLVAGANTQVHLPGDGGDARSFPAPDPQDGADYLGVDASGGGVGDGDVNDGSGDGGSGDGGSGDGGSGDGTAPPPITASDDPPKDLDGDGTFEDVNGDGSVNILDVQKFFVNTNSESVKNNPQAYDYNGDGEVNVIDVQKLFAQTR